MVLYRACALVCVLAQQKNKFPIFENTQFCVRSAGRFLLRRVRDDYYDNRTDHWRYRYHGGDTSGAFVGHEVCPMPRVRNDYESQKKNTEDTFVVEDVHRVIFTGYEMCPMPLVQSCKSYSNSKPNL